MSDSEQSLYDATYVPDSLPDSPMDTLLEPM